MAVIFKTLSATLAANVNEVTFTDSLINSNSIIEVYYNSNDVYTVETWQDGTTIGIVTSDHNFAVGVKVTINNATSFAPYDDTEVLSQLSGLSDDVSALSGRLDSAEDDIDNLENDVDSLETSKQDVLIAGVGITIEDSVISSKTSINYSLDEQEIGLWIDGSKLYQKTYSFGALPNNGLKSLSTGFLDSEIKIIDITGIAINPSTKATLTIPRSWLAADMTKYIIDLICNSIDNYYNIRISDGVDYSSYSETYITIRYIKLS